MKYRCKSRVIYANPSNPVCPIKQACEVEVEEFEPKGCLMLAVYQEWEKIMNEKAKDLEGG